MVPRAAALAVAFGLAGCQGEEPPPIHLNLGEDGARSFVPHTALAESLQIPGDHNELRLLFAEGHASCERHVAPPDNQTTLLVTVVAPEKATIGPGTYAWTPPPAPEEGKDEPAPAVYAIPKVHVGARSFLPPPGGGVQLTKVDLGPNGSVQGILAFEFPGDGKTAATRIQGRISAKICRPGGRNAE
jgi:hypothetical protein